jgi:NADH-quinone oxidoreductase subunit J
MLPDLLFLLFGCGLLVGAGLIVMAPSPMIGILGMLVTFLNAAAMFVLLHAEFLGLLLIMIYVGAIAVMFLFVVMTIDLDFGTLKEGFAPYLPAGLLVVGLLAAELIVAAQLGFFSTSIAPIVGPIEPENIKLLGNLLYTVYAVPFQLAGLILLTAMVGAIILTHRPRSGVQRQNISAQINREKSDAMALTQPKVGAGAGITHWQPKSVVKKVKSHE